MRGYHVDTKGRVEGWLAFAPAPPPRKWPVKPLLETVTIEEDIRRAKANTDTCATGLDLEGPHNVGE